MEQMVIGAVRGTSFTSASRTDPSKSEPGPRHLDPGIFVTLERTVIPALGLTRQENLMKTGSMRSCTPSMRAIVRVRWLWSQELFDEPVNLVIATGTHKGAKVDPHSEGFESSGKSSLDATLPESLGQTTQGEIPASGSGKMPKRKRRGPTRGVPVKEEVFSKIRWTRSFIPGPAEPLHIPIWYGAIYVRRTSQ